MNYTSAKGDFHEDMYRYIDIYWKGPIRQNKTEIKPEEQSEKTELSGEFME